MTEFPLVAKGDADLTKFIAAFGVATASLSAFGTAAGAAATAGLGLAVVALVPAIEAASKFQDEIIKLNTLVGISEDLMRDFEESILQLGPALGKSPDELARAMFAITSGGERSAAAVDLLEQSAKAARLGLGDTAVIARVGTAALQAFADQGLTAAEAIDIMVGTVREGNLVAEELPNAFGRVIGIAGQMGVTFEEVGTFMATFTRLGVSSEIAATSLRATLFAILNPGKEARKTFDELGISVEEMQRRIRDDGLTQAMLELLEATEGNLDTLSDIIPNIRAMSGVLGVYAAQADQVVVIQENMNNIFGVTNEGFETIQGTVSNAMAEMTASIDALVISIGGNFLPIAAAMIDSLTMFVDIADGAIGALETMGSAFSDDFRDMSDAMKGFQRDASETAEKLREFAADARETSAQQLQATLAEVEAQKALIGAQQEAGEGDSVANNNRMNLLIGQEKILNALLRERASELLPKQIEGIRVVVGQTGEQLEATDKLIKKMEEQLLSEEGLEKQILLNELAELNVTEAQQARIISLFDLVEAAEAATEAEKERATQAVKNAVAMNRLATARERQFGRVNERTRVREERAAMAEAVLATDLMVARISDALDRKAKFAQDVASDITDSFEDIINGTTNVADAFGSMVTSILADFARMRIERGLISFLSKLIIPIPNAPGAFPEPVIDPTAGLNSLPSIVGPGAINPDLNFSRSGGQQVIVQQTVNFQISAIDGRDMQSALREQAGTILQTVAEGAQNSTGFARALRGR